MVISKLTINTEQYDAVLFDLDGVVTRTADTHASAWKKLFDEYLKKKSNSDHYLPFDIKDDYVRHVDGKPRYKGVQDFISSRNIAIPYGSIQDAPDKETICGLGNRKNIIFSNLLKTDGVNVYESTIDLIKQLRKNGLKTAVVSSSKNCLKVIKAAEIEDLFDTRVDGVVSENLGLPGKPEPDIFLEAAKILDADVIRCVVVEDALSGVEAGKKGGFGMVIGVNRGDQATQLKEKGAHVVVDDLSEIGTGVLLKNLPNALQSFGKIIGQIGGKEIVIFISYDSILSHSPVFAPGAALNQIIAKILAPLGGPFTVFLIAKENPEQVKKQIHIDNIYYVGSDDSGGYVVKGPGGQSVEIGKHCKQSPRLDRNKGSIVESILEKFNLVSQSIFPIYFGDNVTDKDVFAAVAPIGLGIALGDALHCSNADFRMDSPKQIGQFFRRLSSNLDKGTSWGQIYSGFDPEDEGRREALCALGNGYFVTRAAAPEAIPDGVHYPGTYLAGGYNRLKTEIAGRIIENEDLVNIPNWLCLNFRIHQEEWFQVKDVQILFYSQYLNIKKGVLNRTLRFRDKKNRETILLQQSFVHGNLMHRAALRTIITPLNWHGKIEICSALEGRVTNLGVKRYRDLGNAHLDLIDSKHLSENGMVLKVRTNKSCLNIAMGVRTEALLNNKKDVVKSVPADKPGGYVAKHFVANVSKGDTIAVDKLICIYTSQDTGIFECLSEAKDIVTNDVENYDSLLKSHTIAWDLLWHKFDVRLKLDNKRY